MVVVVVVVSGGGGLENVHKVTGTGREIGGDCGEVGIDEPCTDEVNGIAC